jgi:outer membrane cobalamin receptor
MELSELEVITGSIKAEKKEIAPSNITIITEQMILERGYQTLVDICQDIPGFDFLIYNDGAGNFPTYNINRGLGNLGNPEILIMIDGIVQNNISFNWSLLWKYENIFIDVERVEVIQGPGSVMYGAQAFTGVIHIITKKNFTGTSMHTSYGSYSTLIADVHVGTEITENINLSLAFHKYHTDGDFGLNRFDPGGYFTDNKYPATILADYDSEGNYVENTPNPLAGKEIPDGFYNETNSSAFRTKLKYKNTEFVYFISDQIHGFGSSSLPYEYNLFDTDNLSHFRSFYISGSNNHEITTRINLKSSIVYRETNILPSGGFKYLYRFPELPKVYSAFTSQIYFEEILNYHLNNDNSFSFGFKGAFSQKSEWVISLGHFPDSRSATNSSWDIAVGGNGLNQQKKYPVFFVKEFSTYALWDKNWLKYFSSSLGLRYDYSSEFGRILNPRFAIDYYKRTFGVKLLFGSAFRQPGITELTSEFRGNPNLKPQKIKTTELEINSLISQYKIALKANFFYSKVDQLIGTVKDSTMPAGERHENIDEMQIAGATLNLSIQLQERIRFYSNYGYLIGVDDTFGLYEIERTPKNKFNAGINFRFLDSKLITDFRINHVGQRKAQATNKWLQTYKNGYAPSYTKANFVITYRIIVNNIFNEQFYGVGRESGSGFIDDYDFQNNINPDGFIPAYHPQPGRTYLIKFIAEI